MPEDGAKAFNYHKTSPVRSLTVEAKMQRYNMASMPKIVSRYFQFKTKLTQMDREVACKCSPKANSAFHPSGVGK